MFLFFVPASVQKPSFYAASDILPGPTEVHKQYVFALAQVGSVVHHYHVMERKVLVTKFAATSTAETWMGLPPRRSSHACCY